MKLPAGPSKGISAIGAAEAAVPVLPERGVRALACRGGAG